LGSWKVGWRMQPCRGMTMMRWKRCWRRMQSHRQHLQPQACGGLGALVLLDIHGWSQHGWATLGNKQFSSWAACFFVFNQHFPKGICFWDSLHCMSCAMIWVSYLYICIYIYLLLYICMFYLYIYCTYIHIQIYYTYIHDRYIFFTSSIFKYMYILHT
jgi:hypothetical protein